MAVDRAPDSLAAGAPQPLRGDLAGIVGREQVLGRISDLVRYASDASPYRLFPKVVVQPRDERELAGVLAYARRTGTSVTLRGGGTSLNGQGQGAGILVDVRRHFRGVSAEDDGRLARVRPGTLLGHANRVLAPHGRKLGPDPASTDIATVGGVIANNSGGMRCGTVHDSYSTLRSLTFILASGTTIDTAATGAAERFAAAEPALAAGLAEIRDEITADADLAARIRKKFEIKNTTGYRLCAFLDADEPVEIFRRLLVGSEGTLAFVAEAVFETVAVPRRTAAAWIHFPTVDAAVAPVPELVAAGATAVEMMVAPALISAAHTMAGTPEYWKELAPDSAALLVELAGVDEEGLDRAEAHVARLLEGHELVRPHAFSRDHETVEMFWQVREGMHGLVGRFRPEGSALIVEDVCVPPARIAEAAGDLRELLGRHGFLTGVAGHASAGNLHFMLTPKFSEQAERDNYERFMAGLVELVLEKYDGSLKAEHGTGVNMAPFVEREWGAKATELMWRVKELADPSNVLNPGVVLNRDPAVHLQNLRTTPAIEESANLCVECGFCEPVCPSRDLTTTPRQRIALRREMARQPAGSPVLEALVEEYEYDGLETCAADGSCRTVCPVGIDTGKLVKELRAKLHSPRAERAALRVAERWGSVERLARGGLAVGAAVERVAGDGPLRGGSRAARRLLGEDLVPEWGEAMPPPAPRELPSTTRDGAVAVYLPACINRIFGPPGRSDRSLPEALVEVSARAGMPVWIPADAGGHCCATPWTSKGYTDGAAYMAAKLGASLRRWSGEGELPVVMDASSCTHGAREAAPEGVQVIDSIEWAERLLVGLDAAPRLGSLAVHPTCATRQLGLAGRLAAVAQALAEDVTVPVSATCCGFAGDRGFLHPELTAAATAPQAAELAGRHFDAYVSSNRTCEVGLTRATGESYEGLVQVLERVTRTS